MRTFLQLVIVLTTLITALMIGVLLEQAFWQSRFYIDQILGNKPIPATSAFLIENYRSIKYIGLLPWLLFILMPLVKKRGFRDTNLFILTFLCFIAIELFLLLYFVSFLFLPFIPQYSVLQPVELTGFEIAIRLIFWILTAAGVIGLSFRCLRRFRKPAEQGAAANP